MAAFTANQVTVNNGQKNIVINSSETPDGVRKGDFIGIASFALMEINRTYVDSNNKHVIELVKSWDNSNQSNQPAIVIPTTVDFKQAADALKKANTLFNDNTQAMQDWQTKLGTATFNNIDGTTTTVKTLKQIEADNQAQLAEYHPYPWAIRKVEFEAHRAANNENFAASGFVHKGKVYSAEEYTKVAEGLFTDETTPNILREGRKGGVGSSKSDSPVIHVAGVVTKLEYLCTADEISSVIVKLPPTEDGTRTYDSATGVSVTHATPAIAFASETETNKVVTDRVDMWGILQIEQEINDSYPFVYPNGLPQSLATTMNGVATTTNNIQPIEYFAQYTGDISSRGKGVNWQTATEAQRTLLASDPKNKIYFNDATGKFYQTHNFALSFAGMGNGDWLNIDAITGDLAFSSQSKLIPALAENATKFTVDTEIGVFTANNNPDCHFLVCGTVNRLSQAAYHPSFSPAGAGAVENQAGTGAEPWYATDNPVTSRSESFTKARSLSGSIGTASGRPDGRFYDSIYASGQGGVCRDMRYSAQELTQEDFAEADLTIKSGEYRGIEKLEETFIADLGPQSLVGYGDNSSHFKTPDALTQKLSDIWGVTHTDLNRMLEGSSSVSRNFSNSKAYIILTLEGITYSYLLSFATAGVNITNTSAIDGGPRLNIGHNLTREYDNITIVLSSYNLTGTSYGWDTKLKNLSVASEHTHTEVTGLASNILQCEDLKDGWVGSWNPNYGLPDCKLQTPAFSKYASRDYTTDNGVSWVYESSVEIDLPDNTVPAITDDGAIQITYYKTQAKVTSYSPNTKVYGGLSGLGSVFASHFSVYNLGRGFAFSLTGSVNTGKGTKGISWCSVSESAIRPDIGELYLSDTYPIAHADINLQAQDSSGVKALNYNTVESQQGFINYVGAELKYDDVIGDWGDDGKVHIVDNQTTMLDENGHTVVAFQARCVEPLGWIKNDK